MALISKGIQLYYLWSNNQADHPGGTDHPYDQTLGAEIYGLQEIGELAGIGAGTNRDKIEVTTLADDRHVYVDGIQAESDASAISFKFLFDADVFQFLKTVSKFENDVRSGVIDYELGTYTVRIPAGNAYHSFSFKGYISDLKMDSAGVNAALTMSMSLTPTEAIAFTQASVA